MLEIHFTERAVERAARALVDIFTRQQRWRASYYFCDICCFCILSFYIIF
jgi:hypothetical protein